MVSRLTVNSHLYQTYTGYQAYLRYSAAALPNPFGRGIRNYPVPHESHSKFDGCSLKYISKAPVRFAFITGADEPIVNYFVCLSRTTLLSVKGLKRATSQSKHNGLVMLASVPVRAYGLAAPFYSHAATNLSTSNAVLFLSM